jgi:hypothetical protein
VWHVFSVKLLFSSPSADPLSAPCEESDPASIVPDTDPICAPHCSVYILSYSHHTPQQTALIDSTHIATLFHKSNYITVMPSAPEEPGCEREKQRQREGEAERKTERDRERNCRLVNGH